MLASDKHHGHMYRPQYPGAVASPVVAPADASTEDWAVRQVLGERETSDTQ